MARTRSQLRRLDLRALRKRAGLIGVDEAGRGALAGPVIAGAVAVTREFYDSLWCGRHEPLVNDSKQLTARAREALYETMVAARSEGIFRVHSGSASVPEIEKVNILGATKQAMRRALQTVAKDDLPLPDAALVDGLFAREEPVSSWHILVDGLPLSRFPYAHQAVVQGDGRSLVIALASVFAKVTRDHLMDDLDALYPQYGFREHKGYGTAGHRAAIIQYGPCPAHRPTFLRKLLASQEVVTAAQEELF